MGSESSVSKKPVVHRPIEVEEEEGNTNPKAKKSIQKYSSGKSKKKTTDSNALQCLQT